MVINQVMYWPEKSSENSFGRFNLRKRKRTPSQCLILYLVKTSETLRLPFFSEGVDMVMRKKCPYSELFWSAFSRIWTRYGVSLRIQSECGKMQTRITPNTDTFYVYGTWSKMG